MGTLPEWARIAAYLDSRRRKLRLIELMWGDPRVQCYNDEKLPKRSECTDGEVFLAGPTSRQQILECNWRAEAVYLLREAGFSGMIYVPEPRGDELANDFTDRGYIHRWESSRLFFARRSKRVFWIPRRADELLGLNTNLEMGIAVGLILAEMGRPGRDGKRARSMTYIGWPDDAERMGLLRHYSLERAKCRRYDTLRRLAYAVAGKTPPEDTSRLAKRKR